MRHLVDGRLELPLGPPTSARSNSEKSSLCSFEPVAEVGNWHEGEAEERQSQFGFAPVV